MPISFDNCRSIKDSGKALLVLIPEVDDEPVWVPQSVIDDDSEVWKERQEGTLVVATWWAEKQQWI